MRIGTLGNLLFQTSSNLVHTIESLQESGSARYTTHQRHLSRGLVEFCGSEPGEISIGITLSRGLGVEPEESLVLIRQYEREGTALPFVLGGKTVGEYRWVITGHKVTVAQFDGRGGTASADVTISLREYSKG